MAAQVKCKGNFQCVILKGALNFSDFPLSLLNCCHLSETSQLHCTGRLHRHAPLLSLHTHACRCTHTHTLRNPSADTSPFAHQLCYCLPLYETITRVTLCGNHHRDSEITSIQIPLFPPPSSVSFSCPLSPSLSASLSLIPMAPFPFCHYPTQRPEKIPRISIHTL